jgi:hypothetical protein
MASLLFPLQFERQYSGPLDQDQVFTTTSDRLTYLTNPLRYAGQIVSDLQTQKIYQLNTAKDTWIEIGSGSGSSSTDTEVRSLTSNWESTYSTLSSLSSNWDSTYTTTQSNSANWDSAYSYVAANSVNLTATNIFVTNDLTVTDTVSAKYYQGTLIDWMTLVRGTKTTPTLLATIGTGDVYTYVYSTATTDKTYYRYIATNGSEDSFYGNFTNPTLSNLIATKKIIL